MLLNNIYPKILLRAASKAERAALKNLNRPLSKLPLLCGDSRALSILLNEQLYQLAKLNVIQAQANRLSDTAALFQSLGGGWWNK